MALLLVGLVAACKGGAALTGRLADPPGLEESRAAVLRNARTGLATLRAKYGALEPDGRWTDIDREVLANLLAALRRERESP